MNYQIKNRWSEAVIFKGNFPSLLLTIYASLKSGADLSGADLSGADLSGADLRSADLRGAEGADLAIAQTRILPAGNIIGWKKTKNADGECVIVKLSIPSDARRSHAFGRKCRAEFAEVLELSSGEKSFSQHDETFSYEVGKIVRPAQPFSDDWTEECASGIHFFITREEAEAY